MSSPRVRLLVGLVSIPFGMSCGGVKSDAREVTKTRTEMLSGTEVAKKCEEAAKGHDRPFVVEWDATDLASFEARAASDTVVVRYEGCKLEVLYACQDAWVRGKFGTYGTPQFTSGSLQALDVKTESELVTKLPLGFASLSGRVQSGEGLHLKYFVAGVALSSRNVLYEGDLKKVPGCAGATHYVWSYNLGAFELEASTKFGAEAEASVGGLGSGSGKTEKSATSLAKGGSLDSCATTDQRACRAPIRLALRKIEAGDDPGGGLGPAAGGAPPGTPPGMTTVTPWESTPAGMAMKSIQDAHKKREDGDGEGCLKQLGRAMTLDPTQCDNDGFRWSHAICQMMAGKCAEGRKELRGNLTARDTKRLKTDEEFDKEVRGSANQYCSSAEATNDYDYLWRIEREIRDHRKAKDFAKCDSKGKTIAPRIAKLSPSSEDKMAKTRGISAMEEVAYCTAEAKGCAAGLPMWKAKYALQLTGLKVEKVATDSWETITKKLARVKCTPP